MSCLEFSDTDLYFAQFGLYTYAATVTENTARF